ncbi:enamine deaminase RidA [Pseudomonas agarici]|uniref:Enamine deaminase RidA n=1 Tax=Pseudomonas agarici TaxID=46677 RepID=A0A0X1T7F3_PSEAA|nr:RidA family protein [Pseudomonas agarici]AMB88047.1 enamine deaminase RidA [Pseudomonas agarici]NWB92928.1 RidA family protein [Pseudomonas agarici]NWC09195.1 RidA family protein [Pseudomonas agarici]SEK32029.1 reactive intermediate/imine deaminase [Pseudomonas agarici]
MVDFLSKSISLKQKFHCASITLSAASATERNSSVFLLVENALIEHILTQKAPLPRGHYAQATKANGFVFVSGQLPLTTDTPLTLPEGLDAQVLQALSNMREVLLAAGTDVGALVSVQIYVSNIDNWPRVNELYRQFIGDPAPARTVVPCGELHYGAMVEISAVALCSDVS